MKRKLDYRYLPYIQLVLSKRNEVRILISVCEVQRQFSVSVSVRFNVYFSSKLNIVDACVVVITLVVTMIYTFSDLSGASLIPR